jgi:hypothetical protein
MDKEVLMRAQATRAWLGPLTMIDKIDFVTHVIRTAIIDYGIAPRILFRLCQEAAYDRNRPNNPPKTAAL